MHSHERRRDVHVPFFHGVARLFVRLLLSVTVLGTIGSLSLPRARLSSWAIAQPTTTPDQGRSLYYQICAMCHGQSAEGGGPVPDLKAFQGTDEKFVQITLTGRPDRGMPAWNGKLSEEEIHAVLTFIRALPR